jgi:hypothetical protein
MDFFTHPPDNRRMDTNGIPPELLAQSREAAIEAMSPVRDPEAVRPSRK